jgi:hypothetical protein
MDEVQKPNDSERFTPSWDPLDSTNPFPLTEAVKLRKPITYNSKWSLQRPV